MISMSMGAKVLIPSVQFGNISLETNVTQTMEVDSGASDATLAKANAELQARLVDQMTNNLTVQREAIEKYNKDFYKMNL